MIPALLTVPPLLAITLSTDSLAELIASVCSASTVLAASCPALTDALPASTANVPVATTAIVDTSLTNAACFFL